MRSTAGRRTSRRAMLFARRLIDLCAAVGLGSVLATAPVLGASESVERGRYLLAAAGCAACHTEPEGGEYLAGGRALETPFGIFYAPNITPHPEHGLGLWREETFVSALREGLGPDGHYFPVFPYTSYTRMRVEDARDLWAYLQSVDPVSKPNREHDLPWYLMRPLAARLWKWLFFERGEFELNPAKSNEWNRGAYLVRALSHCGECHTPRTPWGSMKESLALSGNPIGPEGDPVPNLTPDRETGLGKWSLRDIVWYLETGGTPDGDYAGSLMAEVIDHGTSRLTPADRQAIADYLKALPATANSELKRRE